MRLDGLLGMHATGAALLSGSSVCGQTGACMQQRSTSTDWRLPDALHGLIPSTGKAAKPGESPLAAVLYGGDLCISNCSRYLVRKAVQLLGFLAEQPDVRIEQFKERISRFAQAWVHCHYAVILRGLAG